MSLFSGFDKLKDALDDAVGGDQKATPAGPTKTQGEVRSEIHGEERKVHEIQKKSGWSDRIKDVLDGDDEEQKKKDELLRLKVEKEKAEARDRIKEERGFSGKVSVSKVRSTAEASLMVHMYLGARPLGSRGRQEEAGRSRIFTNRC